MLLRSVRIENFRVLRLANICFDPTTVLIGENDCGRSSVMEAVAIALGWNAADGEFHFQPFICTDRRRSRLPFRSYWIFAKAPKGNGAARGLSYCAARCPARYVANQVSATLIVSVTTVSYLAMNQDTLFCGSCGRTPKVPNFITAARPSPSELSPAVFPMTRTASPG
jgi:hypothetical protein